MPERWLAELHRVSRTHPEDDLLRRAEEGPRLPEPSPRSTTRLGAILVAVLIAIVGVSGVFAASRRGAGSTQVASDQTLLWPETSLAGALRVQERVDAGDRDVQWRVDPAAVALRYADEVLGWPSPLAGVSATDDPDVTIVSLNGPDASCEASDCKSPQPQVAVLLTLERVVRTGDGGIWSVTEVSPGS
jgi:hypothetical protein